MCLPASSILASIVTMLVSFEEILMCFKACGRSLIWNWLLKLILTENLFRIASKLTSIVTILANTAFAGDHIFQVLWVLPKYLGVLSQYLRVLSRWIHPKSGLDLYPLNCQRLKWMQIWFSYTSFYVKLDWNKKSLMLLKLESFIYQWWEELGKAEE